MENKFHFTIEDAKALLNNSEQGFVQVTQNGLMKIEYYAPIKTDEQTPHRQDELYIIVSGNSDFYREGKTIKCKKGDVIFVSAQKEHKFVNFSDDFATWIIFYGEEIY